MRGKWLFSGFGSGLGMILAACAVIGACSAAGGDNSTEGAGAGKSSGNGGAGGDGGGFFGVGGNSSGSVGGSCAATVNKAEQVPLGLYLMIDKSGSMGEEGGVKWTAVTTAIKNFVDQPSAAGIGVGLQYFPLSSGVVCGTFCNTNADCGPAQCGPCMVTLPGLPGACSGAGGDSCDIGLYAKPAVVISPLPQIAGVIKSSLNNTSPTGGTPTSAALQGAIDYTKQWMTVNPNNVGVVIFATDGEPKSCQTDLSVINGIAKAGLDGVPSVKTFVIGVGDLAAALDGIANAGGTGKSFLVDTNQNASDQFLQAMNAIRGAALSCAYLIPPPPPNEELDYGAINVQYTPEGGMATLIPQVPYLAACPADGLAWYYDNSKPPKQILLCPSACNTISGDLKGQVDVLVGCKTVIK